MNYNEIVEYIENIPRFVTDKDGRSKSGNENLRVIIKKLSNPQDKCKAIHIAGTNGKGSTAIFTKDILTQKGYKVGVFTSPHLIKVNERIAVYSYEKTSEEDACNSIDNSISKYCITDEDFCECYEIVKKAIDSAMEEGASHPSFFEILFAIAAVYFEKTKPDFVVYETGLGGRLDATNIIHPEITCITSIGLDHEKYLGDSIDKIAAEKAGIIKKGVPVVYNTGSIEADSVINNKATELDVKEINVAKSDYFINDITDKIIDFSIHSGYYNYDHLTLDGSVAPYQVDNASTAIALCNELFSVDEYVMGIEEVQEALSRFYWPGRMEELATNFVVDGAHNQDAIDKFIDSVNKRQRSSSVALLFAVAEDKDYEPMIEMLCERLNLDSVYVTSLNSSRGISADYVAEIFKHYMKKYGRESERVFADDSIENILRKGTEDHRNDGMTLYCVGSLYLVGSIKALFSKEI